MDACAISTMSMLGGLEGRGCWEVRSGGVVGCVGSTMISKPLTEPGSEVDSDWQGQFSEPKQRVGCSEEPQSVTGCSMWRWLWRIR